MVKRYFLLDDDGYVAGISSSSMGGANEVCVEVPQNHGIIIDVHKYVDGEFIKDEERQRKLIAEEEARRNKPTLAEALAVDLLEFKTAYNNVPCQNHKDYPALVDNFLREGEETNEV